ncbi:MAG: iron-sulfur cluster biosynthesis transcriptional regulator SufR [Symploca sp. SIO2C1]|nr:iron-sulfur cluster biosynthesis transcriptional regulator SufR [Symploca sp. SIO2C1]
MTTTQYPSTKQDILQRLLKEERRTAQELAEALNISPQAIRRHLKNLESAGLIEHQQLQEGMGRPQHVYQLTRKGRDRLPNRYGEFAVSLLDTLSETVDKEQFSTILQKQWERKAKEYRERLGNGSLEKRVAKLVKMRQAEGYMAEWHTIKPKDNNGKIGTHYVIVEHNCAISQVAQSFPSVCGHELEMFAVALHDCHVERTHWLNDGEHQCGYLVYQPTE